MRLLICAILLIGLHAPVEAAWREASSANFIVYSDGKETDLVSFTQRVEKFDQVLRIMCGLHEPPAPVKVQIYLVSGMRAVQELEPSHTSTVAGFYSSAPDGAIAVVDRDPATNKFQLDGQTILFHEYSHHFMMQYFPVAYPDWYREGFAEYFATTQIHTDGSVEVGRAEWARLPTL
jgi:hypothetical protein